MVNSHRGNVQIAYDVVTYTIYCHIHRESQKRYVGQTKLTMEQRWNGHVSGAMSGHSNCVFLARAIRAYGPDSFDHEVLETCATREEANAAEIKWIAHFGTTDPARGYNLNSGGGVGRKVSDATRDKIRAASLATNERLGPDGRTERGKKSAATLGADGCSERAKKGAATLGPSGRSSKARKGAETLGAEGCAERSRRAADTLGPDGCRERARRGMETVGPEGRSARAIKRAENMGPEKRSEWARKVNEALGPERRSEIARKRWVTRRENAARRDSQ